MASFPIGFIAPDERSWAWTRCHEDGLREYASQWEDMTRDADPADIDWVYVDALPVPVSPHDQGWPAYWDEQQAEAARNGMEGFWDHLLDEDVLTPVVLGLYGNERGWDQFGFWDGNHRVGAAVVSGRMHVPAVVGIARNVGPADLPEALRTIPEIVARLEARRGSMPRQR